MACKELQEWLSLRVTRVEAAYMYTCLQRRARVCCMYSGGEGPMPLGGFSLLNNTCSWQLAERVLRIGAF